MHTPQMMGQSSPGALHSGQHPSNGLRHIPHASSPASRSKPRRGAPFEFQHAWWRNCIQRHSPPRRRPPYACPHVLSRTARRGRALWGVQGISVRYGNRMRRNTGRQHSVAKCEIITAFSIPFICPHQIVACARCQSILPVGISRILYYSQLALSIVLHDLHSR